MEEGAYRPALQVLHTQAVAKSTSGLEQNHLLAAAPPICDSETALNIRERTTLAQLRSDECQFLDASTHLYMRVCPSVGPSVGPSGTRILKVAKYDRKWLKMIRDWSRKYESV